MTIIVVFTVYCIKCCFMEPKIITYKRVDNV